MTKPDAQSQEEIDLEYLQKFAEEILLGGFPKTNSKASQILDGLPKKLREYLVEIQKIAAQKAEEKNPDDKNLSLDERKKKIEKDQQIQKRIAKISQEIFIIACASNKPLDESLKFHENCKLGVKELSDFGENGLSPLAAVMLSGKNQDDLNKLLDKGANINAKSASGLTVTDLAVLTENQEMAKFLTEKGGKLNLISTEKQQQESKDEASRERKKNDNSAPKNQSNNSKQDLEKLRQVQEQVKQAQEQSRLEQVEIALKLHQERMTQLKKQAQQKTAKQEEEKKQSEEIVRENDRLQAEIVKVAEKKEVTKEQFLSEKIKEEEFVKQDFKQENREPKKDKIKEIEPTEIKKEKNQKTLEIEPKTIQREKSAPPEIDVQKVELSKILGISSVEKIDINKLLFDAVKNNNPTLALLLIHFGGDVNHKENGVSVLSAAVIGGNKSLIETLSIFSSPETRKNVLDANPENKNLVQIISDLSASPKKEVSLEEFKKASENIELKTAAALKQNQREENNISDKEKVLPDKKTPEIDLKKEKSVSDDSLKSEKPKLPERKREGFEGDEKKQRSEQKSVKSERGGGLKKNLEETKSPATSVKIAGNGVTRLEGYQAFKNK